MPRYFFHIRHQDQGLSRDELGLDFLDLETAGEEAWRAALILESEFKFRGEDPRNYAVEVVDTSGEVVLSLPFSKIFHDQQDTERASASPCCRGLSGGGDDAASK